MIEDTCVTGSTLLRIAGGDLEAVRAHARATYPEECCGVLVGLDDGPVTRVTRVVTTTNVHRRRAEHYEIPPQEILTVMKEARASGEAIVGYFHSHPDRSARPSQVDLRDAWSGLSYLIVSVSDGRVESVRSWKRKGGTFNEERLVEAWPATGEQDL